MKKLEGKVAIITGSSRGIGKEIAIKLAQENGKLYTHPALQNVSPEALLKSKTSLQRMAQPEEIAAAVTFLVSDDASYITGSTLAVDGGRL